MLTKNIQSKLNMYLKKKFTDDQIDRMEWHTDTEGNHIYTWVFKLDDKIYYLNLSKHTGIVNLS